MGQSVTGHGSFESIYMEWIISCGLNNSRFRDILSL